MNQHTYLRAYLAGIAIPTPFLLVIITCFFVLRYVYNVPIPIERVIMFPMAVVPNLWGLWNVLYIALHNRFNLPLGALLSRNRRMYYRHTSNGNRSHIRRAEATVLPAT